MVKKIIILITLISLSTLLFSSAIRAINQEKLEEVGIDSNDKFDINSPLFTQKEVNKTYHQPEIKMDGYDLVLENENLALYFKKYTASIRVLNKQTNYLWSSDLASYTLDDYLNAFIRSVQSGFELVYRNQEGKAVKLRASDSNMVKLTSNNVDGKLKVDVNIKSTINKKRETVISFSYFLSLKENSLNVHFDHNSLKEAFDCKLTSLSFFNYFGAVLKDSIPGYIFIPNGNGGLIRYQENSLITAPYQTSFYGSDLNYGTELKEHFFAPIYGMCHGVNQNAVLVNINQGSSFAKFNYYPTGLAQTNDFITSYLNFALRETYMLKIASGDSVLMVPKESYQEDIDFDYHFLSDDAANYVGMAKAYQDILVKDKMLKKGQIKPESSLHIEAFGEEYEQGLIFKKYHKMTKTSELKKIHKDLLEKGIKNPTYTLKGYYKGGFSAASPSNVKFEGRLGKLRDLEGLDYYLNYDPVLTFGSSDKAKSYVLVNMKRERSSIELDQNQKYAFFSQVDEIKKGVNKALDNYGDKLSFSGLPKYLYGDYNNDYDRFETLNLYQEMLSDKTYPMSEPNSYFYPNLKLSFDTPIYHERLKFVSDSVPFLQILLRGYVDLYSPFLNFSSNHQLDLLKCVEYGMYPSFLVTNLKSHYLSNTLSNNLYATEYGKINDRIIADYNFVKSALDLVNGEKILNRVVLENGVYLVSYANGYDICVNYSLTPYHYQDRNVSSMGFEVMKRA